MTTAENETMESQIFVNKGSSMAVDINKKYWMADRNVLGSNSSMQPMSLEHLFNMRPAGLVSKNNTGAFSKQVTSRLCKFWDDLRETLKNMTARMMAIAKAPNTRAA